MKEKGITKGICWLNIGLDRIGISWSGGNLPFSLESGIFFKGNDEERTSLSLLENNQLIHCIW